MIRSDETESIDSSVWNVWNDPMPGDKGVGMTGEGRKTLANTLYEIRIRTKTKLRGFCLVRGLDPERYAMIERGILVPTKHEVGHYLSLVGGLPGRASNMTEARKMMALWAIDLIMEHYLPSISGKACGEEPHTLDIWEKIRKIVADSKED